MEGKRRQRSGEVVRREKERRSEMKGIRGINKNGKVRTERQRKKK